MVMLWARSKPNLKTLLRGHRSGFINENMFQGIFLIISVFVHLQVNLY